jgi:hypothetical protein
MAEFQNYVSPPLCVKKLNRGQEFFYIDFLPNFLPDIWTLMDTIHSSL